MSNEKTRCCVRPTIVLWASIMAAGGAAATPPVDLQQIVSAVRTETGVVALGAAIVGTEGLRSVAVSGERRAGSGDPVSTSDRWHIASCNKAMTSALYGLFVERGMTGFHTSLPELFPELASEMDPAWKEVTAAHLLSHRAGLEDVGVRWWLGARMARGGLIEQRAALAARTLRRAPAHPIGEHRYSNLGYMILAAAIENLGGGEITWEQWIEEAVFEPLGASQGLGFGPPQGEMPEGHKPGWFGLGGMSPVGQGRFADNPPVFGPAGTVHIDFESWAKFAREMLVPGDGVLRADTKRRLMTPYPDATSDYAFGWEVPITLGPGGRRVSHDGSNRMWKSRQVLWLDAGIGLLIATNQPGDAAEAAMDLVVERFAERFAQVSADPAPPR